MTTKRLLLVSSSSTHGTGYLEHCASQIRELFTDTDQILFVPHALADRDGYTEEARTRFLDFGMDLESLHLSTKPREAIAQAAGVFIGGGIAPKILERLNGPGFLRGFRAKGRMEPLMREMPVKVILNDRTALYGPALYAAEILSRNPG